MYFINRALVILKPKQPLVDWAASLPDGDLDDLTLEEARKDCTAFLIPEGKHDGDAEAYLRRNYAVLFEIELDSWYRDPERWPSKRTYQLFMEWFDVDIHGIVMDAVEAPLVRELDTLLQTEPPPLTPQAFKPDDHVIWMRRIPGGDYVEPLSARVLAVTGKRVKIEADDDGKIIVRHVPPESLQRQD
jgi:hypothetical protein